MTEERKQLLDSIGFECDLSTKNIAAWEEMYQRLVEYKKEYKDTKAPAFCKKDPKLGRWVYNQRSTYRNKKMMEERKQRLDSIGFVWELSTRNKATWEEMYKRLVAYKKEQNTSQVLTKYNADIPLGSWVHNQRNLYRNNKMTEERKQLLDSVGFV